MKFIKKASTPEFFIEDTDGLINWNQYLASNKRKLKEFILSKEQYFLCCYCEKKVTVDKESSHIEHIKPKSPQNQYANLTFDYNNLLVSCEGNHFNEIGDNSKTSCGHKKDNFFDENKFLNPTLILDIASFFIFDEDDGTIASSQKEIDKSTYTIDLLNLNGNNNRLAEARKKAKQAFIKNYSTLPVEQRKVKIQKFLQKESNEFITFFRYVFRNLS